jgi:hypothetical protein
MQTWLENFKLNVKLVTIITMKLAKNDKARALLVRMVQNVNLEVIDFLTQQQGYVNYVRMKNFIQVHWEADCSVQIVAAITELIDYHVLSDQLDKNFN